MSRIEVDLARARQQAEQIEEIARILDTLAKNSMAASLAGISSAWQGDNAGMFVRKGDSLQGKVAQTASDLKIAAANLRNAADRLYRAEKKAEELARLRSYGGGGGGRF